LQLRPARGIKMVKLVPSPALSVRGQAGFVLLALLSSAAGTETMKKVRVCARLQQSVCCVALGVPGNACEQRAGPHTTDHTHPPTHHKRWGSLALHDARVSVLPASR
jgi:hypothetical protein